MGSLSRCINSISDIRIKELNLQKGQYMFLARICEKSGINQVDLSNLLKVDKSTTTKVIQKLIRVGYISKKKDNIDKRMWRLYPQNKGLEIYKFIIQDEKRNIEICFKNFTKEERKIVYELVEK